MKKMLLVLVLAAGALVHAQDEPNINELMQDIGDTMLRLLPALYREEDRVLLLENLVRLDYLFEEARPHMDDQPVGARVTYDLLNQRLDEAIAAGDRRSLSLLRRSATDAFELCASCHAQDRVTRRAFGVSKIRELDEYLAAEFSYLTRDYASALTSIDNYFAGDERTRERDQMMLQRLLVIVGEIYADPPFAISRLESVLSELDAQQRERVRDWISIFGRLANDKDDLQSPLAQETIVELDHFLEQEWPDVRAGLNIDEQEAYWVIIRGAATKLLNAHPDSKEVPRLLYWLAVSDRALHYRFFNSLSGAYLERCINDYTDHPFAKRCIDEYDFLALITFSGSGGTHIPDEVQARLSALRAKVYDKAASQ